MSKKKDESTKRIEARKKATHCEFCGAELMFKGGWQDTGLCRQCAEEHYN